MQGSGLTVNRLRLMGSTITSGGNRILAVGTKNAKKAKKDIAPNRGK